jgi:hypothetical protein
MHISLGLDIRNQSTAAQLNIVRVGAYENDLLAVQKQVVIHAFISWQ